MTPPRWRYRAANAAGTVVDGEVEAIDEAVALETLRRQALWPIEVRRLGRASSGAPAVAPLAREGLGTARAAALRALAAMLEGGTPLEVALERLARDGTHPAVRAQLGLVRAQVLAGVALSRALRDVAPSFPPLVSAMAAAGEQSGGLGVALGRVADELEERAELAAQLRATLLYPAVLAVAALVGVGVLLTVVVPRFATILANSGQALPWSTRLLLGVSDAVARGWWVGVPLAGLLGAAGGRWLGTTEGRQWWHGRRLGWPVVGRLETSLAAGRVLRTLAMLLPTGVPLLAALAVARDGLSNVVLADRLDASIGRLRDGAALSTAFDGVLPPLAVQLVSAGEQGGDLGALCARAAAHYETVTRRALRSAVALVEPAIIVLFGGLVAFVALAMLQAIYGINARTL
jgi:type II secretory pathway component PulF